MYSKNDLAKFLEVSRPKYRVGERIVFLKFDLSLMLPIYPSFLSPYPKPTTAGVYLKLALLVIISIVPLCTAAIFAEKAPISMPTTLDVNLLSFILQLK